MIRRMSVRLPDEAVVQLDYLCERSGFARAEMIEALIECSYQEQIALDSRSPSRAWTRLRPYVWRRRVDPPLE